jgi:hypothetical protein
VHVVINHLRRPDRARRSAAPWTRKHVVPLLATDTERSVGEVIASAAAAG